VGYETRVLTAFKVEGKLLPVKKTGFARWKSTRVASNPSKQERPKTSVVPSSILIEPSVINGRQASILNGLLPIQVRLRVRALISERQELNSNST
jgi:hypothetical protein